MTVKCNIFIYLFLGWSGLGMQKHQEKIINISISYVNTSHHQQVMLLTKK